MGLMPGLSFVRKEKHMTEDEIEADDNAWAYFFEKHHGIKRKK